MFALRKVAERKATVNEIKIALEATAHSIKALEEMCAALSAEVERQRIVQGSLEKVVFAQAEAVQAIADRLDAEDRVQATLQA